MAVLPVAISLAQTLVEIDLGANLFDVVPSVTSVEFDKSGAGFPGDTLLTGDIKFAVPTSVSLGASLLFPAGPRLLAGGEIGFLWTTADAKASKIESSDYTLVIGSGDSQMQILRLGAVVRLLFPVTDPRLQPFIQGGLAYAALTLDVPHAPVIEDGLLDLSASGGASWRVARTLSVGASARLDYYLNVQEGRVEGVKDIGDVLRTRSRWSAVSLVIHLGFVR